MDLRICVEKVHEDLTVVYKRASDKWVGKVCDGNRIVVNTECLINIQLFPLNRVNIPLFKTKNSDVKLAVIHVTESKFVACAVLFHFVAFYALVMLPSAYWLFENQFVSF